MPLAWKCYASLEDKIINMQDPTNNHKPTEKNYKHYKEKAPQVRK